MKDDTSHAEISELQDHGLLGLVLLAQFHGIAADPEQLAHQFGRSAEPFSETDLLLAAKHLELKAKIVQQPLDRIGLMALPALALAA
ncbi:cysteine peptidase family C39 domain-containing protein, partial [Chromobacterium vaccinii]|uniref:cysteine peptidase family C39 domain-containing protein n=1 Tax=Chromobacterium vaccinii TaxID=1108595 RepID=UPI00345A01CA